MIASGANVKTVQSELGHKTATMTLDQYGHLFPDDLDDVADKIDDLVLGCAKNVPSLRPGWQRAIAFTQSGQSRGMRTMLPEPGLATSAVFQRLWRRLTIELTQGNHQCEVLAMYRTCVEGQNSIDGLQARVHIASD
jgi:hypothetical protein